MSLNYAFDADVTIPDDTEIAAGATFTKTWRVKNTGTEAWTGFQLSHVEDRAMTTNVTVPVPDCQPGKKVEVSVILTAPDGLGKHLSTWRFRDSKGELWGETLYTRIKVIPATAKPAPQPPTVQPVTGATAQPGKNDLLYIADVTIEDNAKLAAGSRFVKTWRVKNTGSTSWGSGFTLRHNDGTAMTDTTSIPLPVCAPGKEVEVSLELRTPTTPGKYYTEWLAHDAQGEPFGEILWMPIYSVTSSGLAPGDTTPPLKPVKPAVTINTKAPHYSQRDPQWRRDRLGNSGSETIGSWGCQMTCFAMVATALGHRITPKNLNTSMIQQGGFVNGNQTRWNALSVVFSDIQFSGKEDMNPQLVTHIDTSLANGVPVPVQVDRTPRTRYNSSDQHWVLIIARNGNQDYWMYDPADLDPEAKSLMGKYGRPNGTLRNSALAAIFYRKV